ncbi:hypothetical protein [Actinoplanes ianthinogenes]|nr:hypothetical protein [Actinoplanes ianthinogenes]
MVSIDGVRIRAERIRAISWAQSMDHVYSRTLLMREFLRRAAVVVGDSGPPGWPFCDLVAVVDPSVRADAALVAEVAGAVRGAGQFTPIPETCVAALHGARLAAERAVPWPDPFEPLLLMYERGGAFTFNGAGMIEVDLVGIPRRTPREYLSVAPIASLDAAYLDEADAEFAEKLRARRKPAVPPAAGDGS